MDGNGSTQLATRTPLSNLFLLVNLIAQYRRINRWDLSPTGNGNGNDNGIFV